jgi:hypothetical protein
VTRLAVGDGPQTLTNRDGTVVGTIDSISLHLKCPNCGHSWGGIGGEEVKASQSQRQVKDLPPTPNESEQATLLPSATTQVWQHYQATVADANRRKLDSARTTCIKRALKVRTVDECCKAIDALAASSWHNGENPDHKRYLDIQYALGQKSESPDARIDKMTATLATVDGSPTGERDALAKFSPETQESIWREVGQIQRWTTNPDSRALIGCAEDSRRQLERMGLRVVFDGTRFVRFEEIAT